MDSKRDVGRGRKARMEGEREGVEKERSEGGGD